MDMESLLNAGDLCIATVLYWHNRFFVLDEKKSKNLPLAHLFRHVACQSAQGGGHIVLFYLDVQDGIAFIELPRSGKGLAQLVLCFNKETPAIPSDQVGDAAVLPQLEDVKRPIEHRPLSAVAAVVYHNYDWVEAISGDGRDFNASHLECSISYKHYRAQAGVCHLGSHCGRYREPKR